MHAYFTPGARALFGLVAATLFALAAGLTAPACGSGGASAQPTSTGGITSCDPGENIFCRCPGGEAGTKTCRDDGQSFDACVTRIGGCPDPSNPTAASSSSGDGNGGSAGSGASGSSGSGGAAARDLYSPCAKNEDCASGQCPMGFCTKNCAKFDECTLGTGECVQVAMGQICLPNCSVTMDCDDAYGSPSACGYATAVDGTGVTTCSDWNEALKLPPEGSACTDNISCNLGNKGVQAVCAFNACTKGCYVPTDCPQNTVCSSMGALGLCK
jgi:hypothetical protein